MADQPVYMDMDDNDGEIDPNINFDDPDDYEEEYISDSETMPEIMMDMPIFNERLDNVIVVDGLPEVLPEKQDKLRAVLKKTLLSKFGVIKEEVMPVDKETGKSKGYMFVEFENAAEAKASLALDGKALDRQHSLKVNLFTDFENIDNLDEEYHAPERQEFQDRGNLHSWLLDEESRDQFSVIHSQGKTTCIYSHYPGDPQKLDNAEREHWTQRRVTWSPSGLYLATHHDKGIAVWGGENFHQINKFPHPGVNYYQFSPCEKYLVTFASEAREDGSQAVNIWDVVSGQLRRGFQAKGAGRWPIFKWSAHGQYFARLVGPPAVESDAAKLEVYETPSFGLLDKRSLSLAHCRDFEWSPSDSVLSYWVPEQDNNPARVVLLSMPSREEISAKMLFSVADIAMEWHPQGNFLCVKVTRYSKKKNDLDGQAKYAGLYINFEIFRMREKNIPVDKIEIKEPVSLFRWEPYGTKFAFIHGEAGKTGVSFYDVQPASSVEKLKTFDKKPVNVLAWSPQGQYIVMAGLRSLQGLLEWVDSTDLTITATTDHFGASDLEWDPTGRYVITLVSYWNTKVDNAVHFFTCTGNLIYKWNSLDTVCDFKWRPRPRSILTDEDHKRIKKNMRKYTAKFEIQDQLSSTRANKELMMKRSKLRDEYTRWRQRLLKRYAQEKDERLELRGQDTDTDSAQIEEHFEEETVVKLVDLRKKKLDSINTIKEE